MTTALQPTSGNGALERVLVGGDLSKLSEAQRVDYYNTLCHTLGLNPMTQPFQYLTLSGKLVLYAKRDATEQLRKIHGVSIERLEKDRLEDVYVVTAYARDAHGRTDSSTGAVAIGNLKGEALANALMKAETKAKRRVTLSICGLGLLDETEVESIPPPQTEKSHAMAVKALAPPPDDGETRVLEVGQQVKAGRYWFAPITLTGGHVVRAKGDDCIQLCRELCADASPVVLETEPVTKADGTQSEQIKSIRRKSSLALVSELPAEPVIDAEVAAALDAAF